VTSLHVVALRVADRVRRVVWRAFGPRLVGVRGIVVDTDADTDTDTDTRAPKVLLVRHSYGAPAWHLPGGGVKRRETIEQAVRREVREEAGIEVTGPVSLLGTYSNLREGKSDHISVFVIEHWRRHDRDDAEIEATGFFDPRADLPDTTSPGTRRRLDEWMKGHVTAYEW
jgi:ADP-ribose pyrophosphatase YjhB (NUDIX family)